MLKVVSTGYLYSHRGGEFKMYTGRVLTSTKNRCLARFYIDDHKFYQCSPNPGTLANCCVWFAERDDAKARDIFIVYEEKNIARLKKEIERREDSMIEITCAQLSL